MEAAETVPKQSLGDSTSVAHRNVNYGKGSGVPDSKITGVESDADDTEDSGGDYDDKDGDEVGLPKVSPDDEFPNRDVNNGWDENSDDPENPDDELSLEAMGG